MLAPKSLAEVVRQVDNQKDLHEYILSHEGNPGAVTAPEVQYQRHPVSCSDLLNACPVTDALGRRSVERQLHPHKRVPKLNANLHFPHRSLPSIFPAPAPARHNRARTSFGKHRIQQSLLRDPRPVGLPIQPLGRQPMVSRPWARFQWLGLLQWTRASSRISLL